MSHQRGKKYRRLIDKVDRTKAYSVEEAIQLVKDTSFSKFPGSVDVALNLGVDPRQAEQNVRGAANLPFGKGKTVRIVVFAKGQKAVEANELGVEFVGGDDLAEKISGGWLEFDQVVATPDMMAVVGKLGRVLGPRGLMPNPKLGTVTFDVSTAIKELKAGRAEFKVDKAGIAHTSIGNVSMANEHLTGNLLALLDVVQKAKPMTSKGTFMKKLSISATMGPGVQIDLTPYR